MAEANGMVALVPVPRVNLTRFHGVFASNSKYRAQVTLSKRGKRAWRPKANYGQSFSTTDIAFILPILAENLTNNQESKLAELLQYNLRSIRSYLLKEEFQLFWQYVSPYWAGVFLDKWCTKTMRSKIEPMKKVAKMLKRHRSLLLNWFRAKKQFSSGIVEGFNTKAKLTTRKSYGFRTYKAVEIALYHALGALPVPITTHEYF